MDIKQLLAVKRQLNANATESSARLATWAADKRGAMGLLSDEAKQSSEYKTLSKQYADDHNTLRQYNKLVSKNKEYQKALKFEQLERRKIVAKCVKLMS